MSSRRPAAVAAVVFALVAALAWAPPARALGRGVVDLQVSGSQATAAIAVAGLGLELTIGFEEVSGLTPANLGLSARLASPLELIGRLPPGASLPLALPLLVSIEPPAGGGLSFTGLATVGVHTHNLEFLPGSPLRLYKAPAGGAFVDVTEWMGPGSYRARGRCGGFSQFLIVIQLGSAGAGVNTKLARLADLLAAYDETMPSALAEELASDLAAVNAAWVAGDEAGAVAALDDFTATVEAESGSGIPNVWRAARDVTNVAGELRATAATLRFSLGLAGG
jgi:hypothetical protein